MSKANQLPTTVRLNIKVTAELHRVLRIFCAERGLDITTAVRQAIERAVLPSKKTVGAK